MRCLNLKLPSKVTSYKESTLSKLPKLIEKLNEQDMSPEDLFKSTKRYFDNVGSFVEALDCLFMLNKIYINKETGVLYIVKTD